MYSISQALIPAAGRGLRAYPKTQYTPKPLLEIDGKTLLQRNIEILRDALAIKDITIIVGYEGEQLISRYGSGKSLGVSLRYLKCDEPDIGLARGMLLAEEVMQQPFVTILGDELYHHVNHQQLLDHFDAIATFAERGANYYLAAQNTLQQRGKLEADLRQIYPVLAECEGYILFQLMSMEKTVEK